MPASLFKRMWSGVRVESKRLLGVVPRAMHNFLEWQGNYHHSLYKPDASMHLLEDFFSGNSLNDVQTNLLVTSVDRHTNEPFMFKRHHLEYEYSHSMNYRLADIARATSAAPTYFPAAEVHSVDGTSKHSLLDGGMAFNNPAAHILANTIRLYDTQDSRMDRKKVLLISLGTGQSRVASVHSDTGKLLNIDFSLEEPFKVQPVRIINSLMSANSNSVHEELKYHLPPQNYHRVDPHFDRVLDLNSSDHEDLKYLYEQAEAKDSQEKIREIVTRIQSVLSHRA